RFGPRTEFAAPPSGAKEYRGCSGRPSLDHYWVACHAASIAPPPIGTMASGRRAVIFDAKSASGEESPAAPGPSRKPSLANSRNARCAICSESSVRAKKLTRQTRSAAPAAEFGGKKKRSHKAPPAAYMPRPLRARDLQYP